ncbi:MAG: tetratricopeptide repeat protein [Planctomycetes bacterium]|nr:tetratricopeptide repeat protein [Planctomycetota bacterium]
MARRLDASRFACGVARVPIVLLAVLAPVAARAEAEKDLLERAGALRAQGKPAAALDALLKGIEELPASARLHHEAGRACEELGRPESAAEHYVVALRLEAGRVETLTALGVLRSEAGRLEEAEAHLRAAVSIEPGSLAAQHNLAVVLARRGDLEGARAAYGKAAKIAPREAKVRHGLGGVLEKLGRLEEARGELEAAAALDPGLAPAWYRLSCVCFRLGRKEEGERHLRRFRQAKAGQHVARAETHLREGDLRRAARELERALDADEAYVEAHARLGAVYLREGDAPRAVAHARRAAELDPRAVRYANLAWALHGAGDRHEALRWIEKALALDPGKAEYLEERRAILGEAKGGSK